MEAELTSSLNLSISIFFKQSKALIRGGMGYSLFSYISYIRYVFPPGVIRFEPFCSTREFIFKSPEIEDKIGVGTFY